MITGWPDARVDHWVIQGVDRRNGRAWFMGHATSGSRSPSWVTNELDARVFGAFEDAARLIELRGWGGVKLTIAPLSPSLGVGFGPERDARSTNPRT